MQQALCLVQHSNIYSVTGMCTGERALHCDISSKNNNTIFFIFRSWRNHIKSCAPENQVKIYQTLCILLEELSMDKFNELIDQFVQYWIKEEPTFIEYFKQYYLSRPGK